jgi:hypothetical protein
MDASEKISVTHKRIYGKNGKAYEFLGGNRVFDKLGSKSDLFENYVSLDQWGRADEYATAESPGVTTEEWNEIKEFDFNESDLAANFRIYDSQEQYEFME